ncbi:MAG: ester cyclase [Granulosicoccus sp.]|nr:ester cyclase [Granulosicoccus sp.]
MSAAPVELRKSTVAQYWRDLDAADGDTAASVLAQTLSHDVQWHAHFPVGSAHGPQQVFLQVWQPLIDAFDSLQREVFILLEGNSNGRVDGNLSLDARHWVTGTGVMRGRFVNDYCGIPANGKIVTLRWGEFCRFVDDRIVEVYFLVDLIDLLEQLGINVLPACKGEACSYRPPAALDGIVDYPVSSDISVSSLDHIRRFLFDGLNAYDQTSVQSMGMADWFHPDVKWFGPGGIGLCHGFRQFESHHQKPWLHAFPDRQVQNLDALIAEGCYSAASGWGGVVATHKGDYLGCQATDQLLRINGMDWWKLSGDQYIENWVFVDMPHLFKQMGQNLLEGISS